MNINPIQGFKNLTPNQKKAAIAGAIGTAAVAATTILAYTQGKTAEVKGFKAIGAGYQKMGSFIAEKANEAWTAAKKAVDLGDENSLISKAKAGVLELVENVRNLFLTKLQKNVLVVECVLETVLQTVS